MMIAAEKKKQILNVMRFLLILDSRCAMSISSTDDRFCYVCRNSAVVRRTVEFDF